MYFISAHIFWILLCNIIKFQLFQLLLVERWLIIKHFYGIIAIILDIGDVCAGNSANMVWFNENTYIFVNFAFFNTKLRSYWLLVSVTFWSFSCFSTFINSLKRQKLFSFFLFIFYNKFYFLFHPFSPTCYGLVLQKR